MVYVKDYDLLVVPLKLFESDDFKELVDTDESQYVELYSTLNKEA
jgi:hypothetical protein